ncbi:MAG: ATP-binding protein [Candidatus Dormibacteria bacterium]
MIRFKTVRWRNFLSTGASWIEIPLNVQSMILIIGKNGAGKSTLLDALVYGLFGSPYRNINVVGLVNSINNADCVVEVEFQQGSKNFKVIRGQRPSIFELYENGVLVNQDAASRDLQKYLDRTILGFNKKSFTQIIIVGSTSFTPFMRLTQYDRRLIIENLLDIEVFSIMNKVVKARLSTLNATLDDVRIQMTATLDKIELQKRYIADSRKTNEELIVQKQSEVANCQSQIENHGLNVLAMEKVIQELQYNISGEKVLLDRINKLEQFRIKIDSNINKVNKELTFYQDNDVCSTCHQPLSNKEQMLSDCKQRHSEFQEGLYKVEVSQSSLEEQLGEIRKVQQEIDDKQMDVLSLTTAIEQIDVFVKRLTAEIETLKTKAPISEDLLQVSKDMYSKLEALQQQRQETVDGKSYFDLAALLLKDSGIKTKIIKQYLPLINKLVNQYLAAMDFFVNFNIDEEFKETIKSRHRDKFNYENFSEGQKRRIDLSLLFTWRAVAKIKNSINTNLLILDEVLDGSLDSDGMDEFLRLLNTFGNENNVFLISHRGDILADKFNNTLKFELVGNFSEVQS